MNKRIKRAIKKSLRIELRERLKTMKLSELKSIIDPIRRMSEWK